MFTSLKKSLSKIIPYFDYIRALDSKYMSQIDLDNSLILDAGCGDGNFFFRIFGKKRGSIGIDFDGKELVKAKGKYNELMLSDLKKLAFYDNSVDYILSNSVLEHVANVGEALSEFYRVMKNEGKLYITVPVPKESSFMQFINVVFFDSNDRTKEYWIKSLEYVGFKVKRIEAYGDMIEYDVCTYACVFLPLILASFFFVPLLRKVNTEKKSCIFVEAEKIV